MGFFVCWSNFSSPLFGTEVTLIDLRFSLLMAHFEKFLQGMNQVSGGSVTASSLLVKDEFLSLQRSHHGKVKASDDSTRSHALSAELGEENMS